MEYSSVTLSIGPNGPLPRGRCHETITGGRSMNEQLTVKASEPTEVSTPRESASQVDFEEIRRRIDSVTFGLIRGRMVSAPPLGEGWSRAKSEYVEAQYRNWLFLRRRYPDALLPPSFDIDTFWHWHILDTEAYHRDCNLIFGRYMHHHPLAELTADHSGEFEKTQGLYLREFGEEIYEFEEEEDLDGASANV